MSQVRKSSKAVDEKEFNGRRILVTGGTRGIGAAIVDRLTVGGGQLITPGRSMPSGPSQDGFVQADISSAEGIDQIVRVITERIGGIDILIHHVGGSTAQGGRALALTDDDSQHAFE